MQQGILHAAYSDEYFCCVKPAYLIEKVLFDFVKLNPQEIMELGEDPKVMAVKRNRAVTEPTKEEILKILKDLAEQNQLDSDLYAIILNNYEVFIQGAEEIKPIFNSPIADVELFYSELV